MKKPVPSQSAHQLLVQYLNKKLPKRGPKGVDLTGIKLATFLLGAMDNIPGRELAPIISQLRVISDRNLVAATLLRKVINKLQRDRDDFIR